MDANELRDHLGTVLEDLKSGRMKAREATAIAAVAEQMIAVSKAQLAYYALRRQAPAIPFLDSRKVDLPRIVRQDE